MGGPGGSRDTVFWRAMRVAGNTLPIFLRLDYFLNAVAK